MESLSSDMRIRKIIDIVKQEKIVLLEGRLKKQEETELIKRTMEEINTNFTGIEISVLYPEKGNENFLKKLRSNFITLLAGDRQGFTVIGPASIIKEIKKDPNKIQLLAEEQPKKKRK